MAYHVVDPAGLEPTPDHPCDRRSITEAADLTTLALAVYRLAPGDELATTYHYHEHREEVLYVLEGTLSVETPERVFTVDAGEAFVVEPGSPIRPFNPSDAAEAVSVLGAGAPRYDIGRPYEEA